MNIDVHVVQAFVDGQLGGNPAGVVVDANDLTESQKLDIARQIRLSETAFVSRSAVASLKLEFFTPSRQIAHCGHATVATFCLLKQLGMLENGEHSKETIDGLRKVLLKGNQAFMEQNRPNYQYLDSNTDEQSRVLKSVGMNEVDLLTGYGPCIVGTGNRFMLIPVNSIDNLNKLMTNHDLISEISEENDLIGYYVFTPMTHKTGRDASARMFAPRYGIQEEAGTGMAAGPLACFLHDKMNLKKSSVLIEQGWHMSPPSPSVIEVNLEVSDGKVVGLMAGGVAYCKQIKTLSIN